MFVIPSTLFSIFIYLPTLRHTILYFLSFFFLLPLVVRLSFYFSVSISLRQLLCMLRVVFRAWEGTGASICVSGAAVVCVQQM